MSGDVDFREKYEWAINHLEVPGFCIEPAEIERLYAEAHKPKVTAEDVLRENRNAVNQHIWSWNDAIWSQSEGTYVEAAGIGHLHRDAQANCWRNAAIHFAHMIADLRNAARENDDEEWVAHATLAAYKCLVDRNGDMGWDGPAVNAAIRAAYRARNS